MLGDNDDLIEVNDVAPVTESAIRVYTLQGVEGIRRGSRCGGWY
jgi:hypothetical protein